MRRFLAAAMALLAVYLASPAQAQLTTGLGMGGTFLLRDQDILPIADLIGELNYRFAVTKTQLGELGISYGTQINSGETGGQTGGMSYSHFIDPYRSNKIKPGLKAGFFVIDKNELTDLQETTLFAGGGFELDINVQDDDHIVAFAEFYGSVRGDDVGIMRYGVRGALN